MRNCSHIVGIAIAMTATGVSQASIHRQEKKNTDSRVETQTIQPDVRYVVSRDVSKGRIVRAQEGRAGSVRRTYRVKLEDGKPVSKELIKEERTESQPTVFKIGKAGFSFSRGDFTRHKVLDMVATAYYSNVTGSGRTATGERARYGCVAVDPRVVPLGSIVFVEGYGMALACDTGGAIKGHRIDLCYGSRSFADNFGYKHVKVHVLR